MKYLSNIHRDVLESKGAYTIYLVVLIFFLCAVSTPTYPILTFLPRLIIAIIGIGHLVPIYVLFKTTRNKKQNRQICFYVLMLSALAVSSLSRMI